VTGDHVFCKLCAERRHLESSLNYRFANSAASFPHGAETQLVQGSVDPHWCGDDGAEQASANIAWKGSIIT
jgi:hypothetical protein